MTPSLKRTARGHLSRKISLAPINIMRGNLGPGTDEWNVTGSGRKIKQRVKTTLSDNWKQALGDQFVNYITHTNFTFYHFPHCNKDI